MPGRRLIGADLLTDAAQVAEAGPDGTGPGFDMQAMAQLSANIGSLATQMQAQRDQTQRLWQQIRPIPGITIPQITSANGTADYPELLSPRTGYWWDVKTFTCATFTAGSVNVYLGGGQSDSNLALVFSTAGTFQMGTGQLLVSWNQRLIVKAVSVTGNVSPWLTVIEIADTALPAYLM